MCRNHGVPCQTWIHTLIMNMLVLYGVKSAEDISIKICIESYLGKTDKFGKVLKKGADVVSSLVPIVLEVAKTFTGNAELKPDDIGGVIESFLLINNSIL